MGTEVFNTLVGKGVGEKKAKEWAKQIAGIFGACKKASNEKPMLDLEVEQLVHFSPEERQLIGELVEKMVAKNSGPAQDDLNLLTKEHTAADIAMFGRMLASSPTFNTEAAVQVAHAITVHEVAVEDDYFTAVDDLNKGDEDMGAGHIGETEFAAGVYYLYLCVNRGLLVENLGGDEELAKRALAALVEAAAKVAPGGKQNSFGSRAHASYLLAEKGDQQPRSLSVAFLKPVRGDDFLETAIRRIKEKREAMEKVYGACAEAYLEMNAETGQGSLQEIIKFVTE